MVTWDFIFLNHDALQKWNYSSCRVSDVRRRLNVFLQSVLGVEYHKILGPFKYHNERIVQCFGLMQVLSSLAVCTEN